MDSEERQLSDRERTVLLLAAEGLTDKEIAKHLNLSQRTIGTYWERMRQKLGPFSRTQLVARFLRHEADVERSNENYRNVFAEWDEGVWIVSSSGKTIYANKHVAGLMNVPLEELLLADGLQLLQDILGDGCDSFLKQSQKGPAVCEASLTTGHSGTRWLRFRGSPVSDRRGEPSATVVTVQDHTFQSRVKNTLDSCLSSLEFLAHHCTDAVVRVGGDLKCISVNDAFCELHRLVPERVVGRPIDDCDVFQPSLVWMNGIDSCLQSGEPKTIVIQVRKDQLPTHLVPEPSHELTHGSVLCITPLKSMKPLD